MKTLMGNNLGMYMLSPENSHSYQEWNIIQCESRNKVL